MKFREGLLRWSWRRRFVHDVRGLMAHNYEVAPSAAEVLGVRAREGLMWEVFRDLGWQPEAAAYYVVMAPRYGEVRNWWLHKATGIYTPAPEVGARELRAFLADGGDLPANRVPLEDMWRVGGKVFWRDANGNTHFAPADEFDDLSDIPERP